MADNSTVESSVEHSNSTDFCDFNNYNLSQSDLLQQESINNVQGAVNKCEDSVGQSHDVFIKQENANDDTMYMLADNMGQLGAYLNPECTHNVQAKGTVYTRENGAEQPNVLMEQERTKDEHTEGNDYKCEDNAKLPIKLIIRKSLRKHRNKQKSSDFISSSEEYRIYKKNKVNLSKKKIKCNDFDYTTKLPENAIKHKEANVKQFSCDWCKFTTKWAQCLGSHMRKVHIDKEPFNCNICGKKMQSYSQLKKHQTKRKSYKCELCEFSTHLPYSLTAHKRTHEIHKCDQCNFSTDRFHYLTRHKKIHANEKDSKFKCEWCGYRTQWLTNFVTHKRIHTGEKPFKCSFCDYRARRKGDVKVHEMKHTGERPFKCDICEFTTTTASGLKEHKLTHTGEKRYLCDLCGYGTYALSAFKNHNLIHSGEKPFVCDTCGFRARKAFHLKIHIRRHTGEKPYKCDLCDYSAAQPVQVRLHKKSRHSGETTSIDESTQQP